MNIRMLAGQAANLGMNPFQEDSTDRLFLLTFQKFRCIQDREFTPFLSLLWIAVKLTEATLSDL
jgi:hypothetical protein